MRKAGFSSRDRIQGISRWKKRRTPKPRPVGVAELGVSAGGLIAASAALEHGAELAARPRAEVERGPDPLRGQRQALAGRVAGEEDAPFGRGAELVRDPVALVADLLSAEVGGEQIGPLADVVTRPVGAGPDPQLLARGEAPAVAGARVAAVDPDLEVVAVSSRMDLQRPGQRRVDRLEVVTGGEDPPPAERVEDQRGVDRAAVGLDRQVLSVRRRCRGP